MKKYAPRKVYILENGKYTELEYTEFEKQKSKDFSYNDKFFIPVQGCLLEVEKEQYESFYRAKEREKYLKKLDKINGLLSIDAFDKHGKKPLKEKEDDGDNNNNSSTGGSFKETKIQ